MELNSASRFFSSLTPFAIATVATLAIYFNQVLLLLSKIGEVFAGVFDTNVPAYPLAGMAFVLFFIWLRRREVTRLLADTNRDLDITGAGICIALLPLVVLILTGSTFVSSYSFAGLALVCSWMGLVIAARSSLFMFLVPYLLIYSVAVGLVGILTGALGDPLAVAVSWISGGITSILGLPVHWSSVYINFLAAGGTPVSLYISQECSGIASMSILVMIVALMHFDTGIRPKTSFLYALGGSALFLLLNSLRVVGLIVGGIYGGVDLMWNLHGWLGYVFYILGYSLLLILYARQIRGAPIATQQRDPPTC